MKWTTEIVKLGNERNIPLTSRTVQLNILYRTWTAALFPVYTIDVDSTINCVDNRPLLKSNFAKKRMAKLGSKRNRRSRLRHDEIPLPQGHATSFKRANTVDEENREKECPSRQQSWRLSDDPQNLPDRREAIGCFTSADIVRNAYQDPEGVQSSSMSNFSVVLNEVNDVANETGSSLNMRGPERVDFADGQHETGIVLHNEVMSPLMAPRFVVQERIRGGTSSEQNQRECPSPAPNGNLVLSNWRILWAFLMTNGSRKLTKEQYQSIRGLASVFACTNAASWNKAGLDLGLDGTLQKRSVLPHYSTLDRLKPLVLDHLAPRAVEHLEIVDESKAGARFESRLPSGEARITVRTILPTEYARADMSSPAVWAEMRSTALLHAGTLGTSGQQETASPRTCIDLMPVVRGRSWFYGQQKSMNVDCDSQSPSPSPSAYAEKDDTVGARLLGVLRLSENIRRCFGVPSSDSSLLHVRGVFSHSWTVHHFNRREDPHFRENYEYDVSHRDQELSRVFNFVKYESPTDFVSVEVPAIPSEIPEPTYSDTTEKK